MKIIQNKKKKNILTIVCCLHGDEIFGLDVFNYFKKHLEDYPGLKIILTNEKAIAAKKRFIETDLNRSFPGKKNGSHEEALAHDLLSEINVSDYLLDIHTTTSKIQMTPIIVSLNQATEKIINLCSSKEVVLMHGNMSKKSLIGQIDFGVSLEFNFEYAKQRKALTEVIEITKKLLLDKKQKPKTRKVFFIDKKIDKDIVLPKGVENFDFIKNLDLYPFLLYEKSYKDTLGFAASKTEERKI